MIHLAYDRPVTSHPPTPARRAVLGALALGAVGSVGGCSIRTERDAPAIPGIKTQSPPADSTALSAALSASQVLAALAARTPAPWGPRLAAMHREQARRLVEVMTSVGISPAASAPSSTDAPAMASTGALGVAEFGQVNPSALQYARASDPSNTPMFCSLLASYTAAATVLGRTHDSQVVVPDQQLAVTLLPAVRRAVYSLEVVAAQTPPKDRDLVTSSVVSLAATRSRLEAAAGAQAPSAPLSYQLQIAPSTAARRTALSQAVLTDLTQAAARATATNRGSTDAARALVREWGEAAALGWRWGVPMTPFPGLAT